MNLNDFKEYLNNRPYIEDEYTDEELERVLNFSSLILTLFYELDEKFKESEKFNFPLFEEAVYLLTNNPTEEFLSKYEGLSQFSIAGAITATVAQQYLSYLSPLVKAYLAKNGYYQVVDANSSISYNYTIY